MNWTLECNGTEKLLSDWGLSQVKRKLMSHGADELSFKAEGTLADGALLFAPFVDSVTIWRNRTISGGSFSGGTTWFSGLIIQAPRAGSPDAESLQYKATGPWWYLEKLVFHQSYLNIFLGYSVEGDPSSTPQYVASTSSHLFLNQGESAEALVRITTGQQIIDALTWTLKPFTDADVPPPFQIGTINLPLMVPIDEVRDITCAEVIRKMLRWSPDAVTWFDYTTTPPTFNCARRADLALKTIDISQGAPMRDLTVNARYDLKANSVQINYEQSNNVNGAQQLSIFRDFYPNPLPTAPIQQFNSLEFTVDLQGLQSSLTSEKLVVDNITLNDPNWWLARHPQYKPWVNTDPSDSLNQIQSFTLVANSLQRIPTPLDNSQTQPIKDLGFIRELTTGQIAPWMGTVGTGIFKSQRITFKIKANIVHRDGNAFTGNNAITLTYQCLTTNAFSNTYSSETVTQFPDAPPTGLAQFLYEAVSVLQFEGSLTLQEEDVSASVTVGNLFNLIGSANTEWTSMNAMVQSITEDIDKGATNVAFGPVKTLSAGELVDLLRVNRARLVLSPYSLRINGTSS